MPGKGIRYIDIPDTVTSIGDYAFYYCGFKSVTLPDGVTSIGNYAFNYCSSLTSVTIPDGVTSIGEGAFSSCWSLTSVTIPDSATSIGDKAFSGCDDLVSVTLPEGVTSIGKDMFSHCSSLTSVVIPSSVRSIASDAFSECSRLKSIFYTGNKSQWEGLLKSGWNGVVTYYSYGYIYTIAPTVYLNVSDPSAGGEIYTPSNVSLYGITYDIFSDGTAGVKSADTNITNADIPEEINGNPVKNIQNNAFRNCKQLYSVTIPESVTSIG